MDMGQDGHRLDSPRIRRKRGRGRGARTREKNGGLGARDEAATKPAAKPTKPAASAAKRLLQRPLFFHFCGRWRPQNSDWLIFDSKSHENHVI